MSTSSINQRMKKKRRARSEAEYLAHLADVQQRLRGMAVEILKQVQTKDEVRDATEAGNPPADHDVPRLSPRKRGA
jgi:hypothetical protein